MTELYIELALMAVICLVLWLVFVRPGDRDKDKDGNERSHYWHLFNRRNKKN